MVASVGGHQLEYIVWIDHLHEKLINLRDYNSAAVTSRRDEDMQPFRPAGAVQKSSTFSSSMRSPGALSGWSQGTPFWQGSTGSSDPHARRKYKTILTAFDTNVNVKKKGFRSVIYQWQGSV